jgi:hypothetical protein
VRPTGADRQTHENDTRGRRQPRPAVRRIAGLRPGGRRRILGCAGGSAGVSL